MKFTFRLLALLVGLCHIVPAMAGDQVRLFKLVSQKDEVVVGMTTGDLSKLGAGPELDNFARHLAQDGQMSVWQYAVRKDPGGNLQQAPLKRIAVFRNDTLRIENYVTSLPVMPISE